MNAPSTAKKHVSFSDTISSNYFDVLPVDNVPDDDDTPMAISSYDSFSHASLLDTDVSDCSIPVLSPDVVLSNARGGLRKRRGAAESVLDSPKNQRKNKEKDPSASDTKNQKEEIRSITSIGPQLFKVVYRKGKGREMNLPLIVTCPGSGRSYDSVALLDTGSTGSCISTNFVAKHALEMLKLEKPIYAHNADGTINAAGMITDIATLDVTIGNHKETLQFLVTDLGKSDVFLGYEWVEYHNPEINFRNGSVEFTRCPQSCVRIARVDVKEEEVDDAEDRFFMIDADAYARSIQTHNEEMERCIRITKLRATAMDIAIEQSKHKKMKSFDEMVPPVYHDFVDVFQEDTFDQLPTRRPWDHAIELVPGAKPYAGSVYSMTLDEQKALDEMLEEHLKTGRIRPSKSPWGAPFFFVKKKDGKLRPVQDYRKLNELTIKNKYPLPLISDLITKLKGAKYFTKMDIRWGYNNVRIREGDEEKAAFITNRGLFEPLVMFFGLTNSPATFQMMMNDIFRQLVLQGKVIVYLDDILIFTDDLDEHRRITRQVLKILRENKLTCKPEKCEFEQLEVEYLGHIISHNSVRMDPAKVAGVAEWPIPKAKRELQQFLGFANFYRRFVKDYSKIAQPLTKLTGQAEWT